MTTSEVTQITIAAILALTLIAVLWYAWQARRQAEELRKGLRSSVYASSITHTLMVDQTFVNSPELRPYFYDGQDITVADPNYLRAVAVAELLLDHFQSVLAYMEDFPKEWWPREGWAEYIKDSFANSPLLCTYLESVKHWYSDELTAVWEEGQKRRAEVLDNSSDR